MLVSAAEVDRSATNPDQTGTDRDWTDNWLRVERVEALIEVDHWRRVAEEERAGRIKAEAVAGAAKAMLEREKERADRLEVALAEARKPVLLRLLEALRRR